MKTSILLAAVAGSVWLSGCNTTQTSTTTTAGTTRAAVHGNENVKIINGKRYVYVHQELGSNIPGRWVPEDSAEAQLARSAGTLDQNSFRKTQDMQGQSLDPGGAKAVPQSFRGPGG
jgi:hypothetical protein